MKLWRRKSPRFNLRYAVLSLCGLGIAALLLSLLSGRVSESVAERSRRIAAEAIDRALVACYAAEGGYPSSLAYLEEHYGIVIDREAYFVSYEMFASNVMPDVTLIERRP